MSSRQRARGSHKIGDVTITDYDTWYTYDIDRWVWKEDRQAAGVNKAPYWPKVDDLTPHDPPHLGDIRDGGRREQYWLNLDCEGTARTATLEHRRWDAIPDATMLLADVNLFGVVRDVELPETESDAAGKR